MGSELTDVVSDTVVGEVEVREIVTGGITSLNETCDVVAAVVVSAAVVVVVGAVVIAAAVGAVAAAVVAAALVPDIVVGVAKFTGTGKTGSSCNDIAEHGLLGTDVGD